MNVNPQFQGSPVILAITFVYPRIVFNYLFYMYFFIFVKRMRKQYIILPKFIMVSSKSIRGSLFILTFDQIPFSSSTSMEDIGDFDNSGGLQSYLMAKCTHCGNMKHTCDTCFKLHGYPDWWNELQARKRRGAMGTDGDMGKAAMAIVPVESS